MKRNQKKKTGVRPPEAVLCLKKATGRVVYPVLELSDSLQVLLKREDGDNSVLSGFSPADPNILNALRRCGDPARKPDEHGPLRFRSGNAKRLLEDCRGYSVAIDARALARIRGIGALASRVA